ncbi:hypothetical protein JHW43_001567 [Diplocarpon mali]|nr:hypothetical protein JHW43_001567 [Diplocarpon mali]
MQPPASRRNGAISAFQLQAVKPSRNSSSVRQTTPREQLYRRPGSGPCHSLNQETRIGNRSPSDGVVVIAPQQPTRAQHGRSSRLAVSPTPHHRLLVCRSHRRRPATSRVRPIRLARRRQAGTGVQV